MLILLQIALTSVAARLCSAIARRARQPGVIGEIVSGIALGPTLFGAVLPRAYQTVFSPDSLQALRWLSEIGVALFMFTVGMEIDLALVRKRPHVTIAVSHVSIAVPFLLGLCMAGSLYERFAPPGTRFIVFALFLGVAMSITAFPVLARILSERRMSHTPVGTLALTCAAVDDVTAWCLLAALTAVARAERVAPALWSATAIAALTLFMLTVVRPLLRRIQAGPFLCLLVLLGSAALTAAMGMHPIFGAFIAGVVVPREARTRELLLPKLEVACAVLLPLFFAATGIRTHIQLLGSAGGWLVCAAVIATATLGKMGGSAAAARLTGSSWREAYMIGALMNTRGLMELVVLNLGYDLGIMSPALFSVMVMMALVTTAATSPLLRLAEGSGRRARAPLPAPENF